MMELKVRRIGNSLGVVLPKEAVSRLNADEGDGFCSRRPGRRLPADRRIIPPSKRK